MEAETAQGRDRYELDVDLDRSVFRRGTFSPASRRLREEVDPLAKIHARYDRLCPGPGPGRSPSRGPDPNLRRNTQCSHGAEFPLPLSQYVACVEIAEHVIDNLGRYIKVGEQLFH